MNPTDAKNQGKEKAPITFESESQVSEEIQCIINQLNEDAQGDQLIEQYLFGLNQMYTFFQDSYKRNVHLLEIVQEMNALIVTNASKIQLIAKTTSTDQNSLSKLKSEFEEASRMVMFAHKSELKSKELLKSLRKSVSDLAEQVQRGEAFSFGEDGSIFEISQDVRNLEKERDDANQQIATLEEKSNSLKNYIAQCTKDCQSLKQETDKLHSTLNDRNNMIRQMDDTIHDTKTALNEIKPDIIRQKQELEKLSKEKAKHNHLTSELRKTNYNSLSRYGQLRDESKILKEKCNKRTRYKDEQHRLAASKMNRIEMINEKVADCDVQIVELEKDLQKTLALQTELEAQYAVQTKEAEDIAEKKAEIRKHARELRPLLIQTQFSLFKSDNDNTLEQRQVMAQKINLTKQANLHQEAVLENAEVENASKTIKSETKHVKPTLQSMKDKIAVLFKEIDEKRAEQFRVAANIQMTQENAQINQEQNTQQLQELKQLQIKSEHQTALSDTLRNERNTYKRLFEAKTKENQELQIQNSQLDKTIEELNNKYDSMLKEIALNHFGSRKRNEKSKMITESIAECSQGIQVTERMISRLQAEAQTLNHIIRESEHDRLQLEKEHNLLNNNQSIVREALYGKDRQLESQRSSIHTTEAFIKKCGQLYKEKTEEIAHLMGTLRQLQSETQKLEEKREKMGTLEYEMHRNLTAALVEQRKTVTLIHEFSIPRNVHRWSVIEAVDPTYVKNLKYRSIMSGKIDAAHRELIELREKKAQSLQLLQNLKKEAESKQSKEVVLGAIKTYNEDMKRMDEKLQEFESLLNNNKNSVGTSIKQIETARKSLTQRKGETSVVKNEIYNIKTQSEDFVPYFITEIPAHDEFMGGGFSKTNLTTQSTPAAEIKVGPTPPVTRKNTNRLNFYTPLVPKPSKSPKNLNTFLGRNMVLPSMTSSD